MGCYNSTGFVSGLSIRCSDPIVAIPCIIENGGSYNPTCFYTVSQIMPISLPLFGKYDDYGSIEDIEDTPSAKAWKMSVCDDVVGCMRVFERSNDSYTELSKILKNEKEHLGDKYKQIKDGLYNSLSPSDNICLILEHRKVYEELTKNIKPKTKEFFDDLTMFKRKIAKFQNYKMTSFQLSSFDLWGNTDELTEEILNESDRLKEKYCDYGHNPFEGFFWRFIIPFPIYRDGIFKIDGISDAFTAFSTFNIAIMRLNVGYRVPSCNCGGQNDFNKNVIKFHDFLSDFYNGDLKEEEYEDDDEQID